MPFSLVLRCIFNSLPCLVCWLPNQGKLLRNATQWGEPGFRYSGTKLLGGQSITFISDAYDYSYIQNRLWTLWRHTRTLWRTKTDRGPGWTRWCDKSFTSCPSTLHRRKWTALFSPNQRPTLNLSHLRTSQKVNQSGFNFVNILWAVFCIKVLCTPFPYLKTNRIFWQLGIGEKTAC